MFHVRLIKAEGLRRAIVLFFYIAALIVAILLLTNGTNVQEASSGLMVLVLIPFGLWFEFVRYIYTLGNKELNITGEPEKCLKHTRFVMKVDFFLHQYEEMAPYQEGLALMDLNMINEAKQQIRDRLGKRYDKEKEHNFELNFLLFSIAVAKKDPTDFKRCYEKMNKILGAQPRLSADVATLKNYIEGIHLMQNGEYIKAKNIFESLDTNAFKNRQLAYYYFYYSRILNNTNAKEKAQEAYNKALEIYPKNEYIKAHPIA